MAAVVIAPGEDAAARVAAAQEAGAAALIAGGGWPVPFGADGLHLPADALSPIKAKPEGAMCGAAAGDRHGAMMAGEAGADYLWFDGAGDVAAACALGAWWQTVFEVPAVVAGGRADLKVLVESRAEFVAMVDAFDDHDEAALVAAANTALDAAQEAA
ncbi:MAG: hypothetical protein AAFW98_02205 [Pseudomonadota bacterium]